MLATVFSLLISHRNTLKYVECDDKYNNYERENEMLDSHFYNVKWFLCYICHTSSSLIIHLYMDGLNIMWVDLTAKCSDNKPHLFLLLNVLCWPKRVISYWCQFLYHKEKIFVMVLIVNLPALPVPVNISIYWVNQFLYVDSNFSLLGWQILFETKLSLVRHHCLVDCNIAMKRILIRYTTLNYIKHEIRIRVF